MPNASNKQNPSEGMNTNRSLIKVPTGKTRLLTTENVSEKNKMLKAMSGSLFQNLKAQNAAKAITASVSNTAGDENVCAVIANG